MKTLTDAELSAAADAINRQIAALDIIDAAARAEYTRLTSQLRSLLRESNRRWRATRHQVAA